MDGVSLFGPRGINNDTQVDWSEEDSQATYASQDDGVDLAEHAVSPGPGPCEVAPSSGSSPSSTDVLPAARERVVAAASAGQPAPHFSTSRYNKLMGSSVKQGRVRRRAQRRAERRAYFLGQFGHPTLTTESEPTSAGGYSTFPDCCAPSSDAEPASTHVGVKRIRLDDGPAAGAATGVGANDAGLQPQIQQPQAPALTIEALGRVPHIANDESAPPSGILPPPIKRILPKSWAAILGAVRVAGQGGPGPAAGSPGLPLAATCNDPAGTSGSEGDDEQDSGDSGYDTDATGDTNKWGETPDEVDSDDDDRSGDSSHDSQSHDSSDADDSSDDDDSFDGPAWTDSQLWQYALSYEFHLLD